MLNEDLANNILNLKQTASQWALQYIVKGFREDNYIYISELAKIALITRVTNAWPARGTSAVERVKSRMWSAMKVDLLNSLLHISINGPPANGEPDQLLERLCNAYANEKHKKILQVYSLGKTEASSLTQSENNVESAAENCEEETSCLKFFLSYFYQPSFMIPNFTGEEFSEEDVTSTMLK